MKITAVFLMACFSACGFGPAFAGEPIENVPEHMSSVTLAPTFFDGDVTVECTRSDPAPRYDACKVVVGSDQEYAIELYDWDRPSARALATKAPVFRQSAPEVIRAQNNGPLPQWLRIVVWSKTGKEEHYINLRTY